jgi:hypothetical protein
MSTTHYNTSTIRARHALKLKKVIKQTRKEVDGIGLIVLFIIIILALIFIR